MSKVVINNYTIDLDQELGSGNFATVYRAVDNKTRQTYAAKLLSKIQIEMDEHRRQSFEEELVAMQTKSEHIVKFVQMFEDNDHYYIIQELCDGNLREYLKKATWLQEEKATRLLTEICIGVKALVRRNITHRDLKPENILLKGGRIKIADFGVSKKNLHNKCSIQIPAGSLTYMSLQALKGEKYTSKGDVWTIGLIFYELLHGQCPWYREGDTHRSLIKKIQTQKVKAKSSLSSNTKSFLKRCLQVDEENRVDWPQFFSHPIFMGLFSEYIEERKCMEKKMSSVLVSLGYTMGSKDRQFVNSFPHLYMDNVELLLPQFQDLLKWIDPSLNKHEIQYIFEQTDMDKDGNVSIDELKLKIQKCSEAPLSAPPSLLRGRSESDHMRNSSSEILSQYKLAKMDEIAKKDKLKSSFSKMQGIISLKGLTMEKVYKQMATQGTKMNKETFFSFIKKYCVDLPDNQILDIFNLLACNLGSAGLVQFKDFNRIYETALCDDLVQLKLTKKSTAPTMYNSFHSAEQLGNSCELGRKEDILYMSFHESEHSLPLSAFNKPHDLKRQSQVKRSMLKNSNSGISTENGSSVMRKNDKLRTTRGKTSVIVAEREDEWAI